MKLPRTVFPLLLLSSCVSMPVSQPPQDLMVPGAPADIVREAARALALAEFELTNSDAASGTLQAKRVRGPRGNNAYLKCFFDPNGANAAAGTLRSTIAVTVSAVARRDSSAVRIATVVTSSYPGMTGALARADNEEDCVSNGSIEQRLVSALKR